MSAPSSLNPAFRWTILRVTQLHAIHNEEYRVTVETNTGNFISEQELEICEELFCWTEGAQHAWEAWRLSHELDESESCLGSTLQWIKTRVYVAFHRIHPQQVPQGTHGVQVNREHCRAVYCRCTPEYEVRINRNKRCYGTLECQEV
jgi:hypothetical protein